MTDSFVWMNESFLQVSESFCRASLSFAWMDLSFIWMNESFQREGLSFGCPSGSVPGSPPCTALKPGYGVKPITFSHSAKRFGQSVGQGTSAGRRPKPWPPFA